MDLEYEQRLLGTQGCCSVSGSDLRYIAHRNNSNWTRRFALKTLQNVNQEMHNTPYSCLLRNELLGTSISHINLNQEKDNSDIQLGDYRPPSNAERLLAYQAPMGQQRQPFSLLSTSTHELLCKGRKPKRRLNPLPFKILDAPYLYDDFYLNLVDWSRNDYLGVGLGCSVYLWNGMNGQVKLACDLTNETVTALAWHEDGRKLAVGSITGIVSIWDASCKRLLNILQGHEQRVSALAWHGNTLCSGSRDKCILKNDIRATPTEQTCLHGHTQEVCGLQWSPNGQYLASSGTDHRVMVWTGHGKEPLHKFEEHKAAVRGLGWSPHKSGLLASGGGLLDRTVRFWNVLTGQLIQSVDTGSQITKLAWAPESNELVTTHGQLFPQIIVWRYPLMKQVAQLAGHATRVVYLAVSPDGENIVTGAGDETLRFWSTFTKQPKPKPGRSILELGTQIR